MLSVVDEVLSGSPAFKIIDNATGTVLYADVSIELITTVLTQGTAISKALFDSIATDITNIVNGTTIVGKATNDKNGADITATYEPTANKVSSVSASTTNFPTCTAVINYVTTAISGITITMDNTPTQRKSKRSNKRWIIYSNWKCRKFIECNLGGVICQ